MSVRTGGKKRRLMWTLGAVLAMSAPGAALAQLPGPSDCGGGDYCVMIDDAVSVAGSQSAGAPMVIDGGSLTISGPDGKVDNPSYTSVNNGSVSGVWLVVGDGLTLGDDRGGGLRTTDLDIATNGNGKALFTSGVYINGRFDDVNGEHDGVSATYLRLTTESGIGNIGPNTLATKDLELVNGFATFSGGIKIESNADVSAKSLLISAFPENEDDIGDAFADANGILISAALEHTGGSGLFDSITLTNDADGSFKARAITISGSADWTDDALAAKVLNVNAESAINLSDELRLESGGTINVASRGLGASWTGIISDDDGTNPPAAAFVMTGGELNIGDGVGDGDVWLHTAAMGGGTVNIQGYNVNGGSFDGYGSFGADRSFEMTGGIINMGNYSYLATGEPPAPDAEDLFLDLLGGTINMDGEAGKESIIEAGSHYDEDDKADDGEGYTPLNIHGATINVGAGKSGALIARVTDFSAGALNVNGRLLVAGNSGVEVSDAPLYESIADPQVSQWGIFNLEGGAITIGANGLMDLVTADVVLNLKGGALNGTLSLGDTLGTATGALYAKEAAVGSESAVSALHISAGAAGRSLELFNKLVVNGAFTLDEGITQDALYMNDSGSLFAKFDEVLTRNANGVFGIQDDNAELAELLANSQGLLSLSSSETILYTQAQLNDLKALLDIDGGTTWKLALANAGLVDDEGKAETITIGESDTPGTVAVEDGSATSGTVNEVTINATPQGPDNTVTIASTDGSSLESKTVTITDDTVETVKVATDVTLSGNGVGADDPLLAKGGPNKTAVGTIAIDDAALNLGAAGGAGQAGTVGDIEFTANGGELNVNDGAFTTGTITADGGGDVKITLNSAGLSTGDGDIVFGDSAQNSIEVLAGSELATNNVTFGNATTANVMKIDEGAVTANNISFENGSSGKNELGVTGTLTAGNIIGHDSGNTTISVGDSLGAGHIAANEVSNAAIILDPAFIDGVENSSTMIVRSINNVSLAVLQNSWFMVSDHTQTQAEAWMAEHIPGGQLTESAYTAALALRGRITLPDTEYLDVDGGKTSDDYAPTSSTAVAAGNANFAANSLLLVDVGAIGTAAAVTGTGTVKALIDDKATLKLVGANIGTYTILGGFAAISVTDGWGNGGTDGSKLLFDTAMLSGAGAASGGNYIVTVTQNAAATVFPKLSSSLAGMVDSIVANGDYDPNQTDPGLQFISRVMSNDFIATADMPRTLEGVARLVAAAGTPAVTGSVMAKVSGLIVEHNNLLNDTQPAYGGEAGGLGLWLNPFYGLSDVDGLDAGQFENAYEINYGGAAFGLDYNLSQSFRLGLALSVGGGDSESQGDFNKTENDFDFFGLSLYGSYTNGAFGLTGDLGYTAVDNEIEQKLAATLGSRLKTNVDSDALTVGLTGQYRFKAGETLNVTPHLGLRYTKISTDEAGVKNGAARVLNIDTEDQNLFQIPLGVKFSGDFATGGGWVVTPSADLGVLFTMGDTDVDSRFRVPGNAYSARTNTDAVDKAAFTGALGIQAKAAGGLTLGLEYGLLASGSQTDHSVSGLLRFDF